MPSRISKSLNVKLNGKHSNDENYENSHEFNGEFIRKIDSNGSKRSFYNNDTIYDGSIMSGFASLSTVTPLPHQLHQPPPISFIKQSQIWQYNNDIDLNDDGSISYQKHKYKNQSFNDEFNSMQKEHFNEISLNNLSINLSKNTQNIKSEKNASIKYNNKIKLLKNKI